MSRRALIIVDPQNDFMPGGALAVPEGDAIVPAANRMLGGTSPAGQWDLVVITKDEHPPGHCSFKKQGGLWPPHCVQGTAGADIASGLVLDAPEKPGLFVVVRKGWEQTGNSYSAFFDNTQEYKTELDAILKQRCIDEIFICGLATDYCVKFTVLDARDLRIPTTVVLDACRAVNTAPLDEKKALVEMAEAGAKLTVVDKVFR